MDLTAFKAGLAQDGYTEIDTRAIEPNLYNPAHSHPFHVRAQLLEGELTLAWDGQQRTFRAGEVFTMAAGCEHTERFGPEGARYIVGRKAAATD
ncbi:MAG: cupin domain-containing protein [Burkholderiales bacterium]